MPIYSVYTFFSRNSVGEAKGGLTSIKAHFVVEQSRGVEVSEATSSCSSKMRGISSVEV